MSLTSHALKYLAIEMRARGYQTLVGEELQCHAVQIIAIAIARDPMALTVIVLVGMQLT